MSRLHEMIVHREQRVLDLARLRIGKQIVSDRSLDAELDDPDHRSIPPGERAQASEPVRSA
jgi:hypothetical protein